MQSVYSTAPADWVIMFGEEKTKVCSADLSISVAKKPDPELSIWEVNVKLGQGENLSTYIQRVRKTDGQTDRQLCVCVFVHYIIDMFQGRQGLVDQFFLYPYNQILVTCIILSDHLSHPVMPVLIHFLWEVC